MRAPRKRRRPSSICLGRGRAHSAPERNLPSNHHHHHHRLIVLPISFVQDRTNMSKPLIDLPSSISADGWADDLFKAAGTRPDPTVKAPPPPPMAGPSTSSSSTINGSRTPVKENKPILSEPRPSVTNGHGQSTSEYTAQTMPAGGLAATLSYPGHSSFPASDEDGRLKVRLFNLYCMD